MTVVVESSARAEGPSRVVDLLTVLFGRALTPSNASADPSTHELTGGSIRSRAHPGAAAPSEIGNPIESADDIEFIATLSSNHIGLRRN